LKKKVLTKCHSEVSEITTSIYNVDVKEQVLVANYLEEIRPYWSFIRKTFFVLKGNLSSMKRGNDDTDMAKKETECGLCFENFHDFKEGDKVECFSKTFNKQEVEWKWNF
jgi:translation initiation factor IF-2